MELHELYWSIFISDSFTTTDSDLMLLVAGEDSRTLNHSGELKVQQELVGSHPCPSHRGSPLG